MGISPLIATAIIISLVFALGAIIAPFTFQLATTTTNETTTTVTETLKCRNMAYDFETSFGIDGVNWNFSGSTTLVEVRIMNTGTINVHDFSFEILLNSTNGLEIKHYDTNSSFQKTSSSPLKPSQSAILRAAIPDDLNGTLKEVKILNQVCLNVFVRQEL